jgi:hypothetical protein
MSLTAQLFLSQSLSSITMSKLAGTLKWVSPCESNFGEEMCGYLQENMSDCESECAIVGTNP